MTVGEIRAYASDLLRGNWLIMMVGYVLSLVTWTLVTQIITAIIGGQTIFSFVEPILEGWSGFEISYLIFPVLGIVLFILADMLHMSYRWFGLDLVDYKKEHLEVKNIFQGFLSGRGKKLFELVVIRFVLVFLWSLLFILPGIWKAYSYSQAANILKDQPELSSKEVLKQSEEKMKGRIGKYMLIQLTYAPWYIIPIALYILFIVNNLDEIAIGIEMGPEGVELIYGMLFAVLLMLGLLLILFSLYVEPKKMVTKQVFYRRIFSPETDETYDEFEKKLLKDQGLLQKHNRR